MKAKDNDIKKALQENMPCIDDSLFTKNIVNKHLAEKKVFKNSTFTNFLPLIIGLSTMILSIGLILFIRQNNSWAFEMELTENHGLLLFMMSFILLLFKWAEGNTAPNKVYSS